MSRRLVLLRHAKSAWPSGVPDHDRPLGGRGRRDAQAAGHWFATEGPLPDLVLCSDALRTRHTWEIAGAALAAAPKLELKPALYGASAQTVLALARTSSPDVRTLLVIGHEPTMSSTSLMLAGPGSDPTALDRVRVKFPTSAITVLRFEGRWGDLTAGHAVLETFAVPRG